MKKQDLKFHFHNPNSEEVSAYYVTKVLLEANREKTEKIIQDIIDKSLSCPDLNINDH